MRITLISQNKQLTDLALSIESDIYHFKCFENLEQAMLEIASGTGVLIVDDHVDLAMLASLKEQLDDSLPLLLYVEDSGVPEKVEALSQLGLDDILSLEHAPRLLEKKLASYNKLQNRISQLSIDYEFAHKTAMDAMVGNSELGQVMNFVEQSYGTDTCPGLAKKLFATTDALGLNCVLLLEINDENLFFSSNEVVKPLEEQLLLAAKGKNRFHDFGIRTVLNYPHASLLIKNMPVEDINRYGRIKDALPVLLGSLDAKMTNLATENMIRLQTEELGSAFDVVKYSFMHLNQLLSEKIKTGNKTMSTVLHDLSFKLPGMGLEEDQEDYILEKVETVMDDSSELLVAEREMSEIFDSIRDNLHHLVEKQNRMLGLLIAEKREQESESKEEFSNANIELF
ncbi:MAG: hypothetical protein HUJ29_11890 [Gammaproteobacteria bacterium]|nr:hypothetical protein [Gammaproteobacteria bacterium]